MRPFHSISPSVSSDSMLYRTWTHWFVFLLQYVNSFVTSGNHFSNALLSLLFLHATETVSAFPVSGIRYLSSSVYQVSGFLLLWSPSSPCLRGHRWSLSAAPVRFVPFVPIAVPLCAHHMDYLKNPLPQWLFFVPCFRLLLFLSCSQTRTVYAPCLCLCTAWTACEGCILIPVMHLLIYGTAI